MSEIKFEMKQVTEKREKKSKKVSIYDPIIDKFLETGHDLVERARGASVGMDEEPLDRIEGKVEERAQW